MILESQAALLDPWDSSKQIACALVCFLFNRLPGRLKLPINTRPVNIDFFQLHQEGLIYYFSLMRQCAADTHIITRVGLSAQCTPVPTGCSQLAHHPFQAELHAIQLTFSHKGQHLLLTFLACPSRTHSPQHSCCVSVTPTGWKPCNCTQVSSSFCLLSVL